MKKQAFTLIELLVVIAVIALLMSVMLPALRKAKESAEFVICKNQLHQLGLASLAYAHDNDDRLPPGDHVDGLVIVKHAIGVIPSGSCNLGHLIEGNYVQPPWNGKDFILWCPTAKKNKQVFGSFGVVFTVDYFKNLWENRNNLPLDAASTLFTAYDYRDSTDGRNTLSDKVQSGIKTSKLRGDNSIIMDSPRLKWHMVGEENQFGFHRSGTDSKYNVLQAGGSVLPLNDEKGEWMHAYFVGRANAKIPRGEKDNSAPISWKDDEFFDIVDQYFAAPLFPLPVEKSTSGW